MDYRPTYTLLNQISPPTHLYKVAQLITTKEKNANLFL